MKWKIWVGYTCDFQIWTHLSVKLWSKGVLEDAVWEPPSFLKANFQGSRAPKGELPQAQYLKKTITCLSTCNKNQFTFPWCVCISFVIFPWGWHTLDIRNRLKPDFLFYAYFFHDQDYNSRMVKVFHGVLVYVNSLKVLALYSTTAMVSLWLP